MYKAIREVLRHRHLLESGNITARLCNLVSKMVEQRSTELTV
jgi:hypothetical protein